VYTWGKRPKKSSKITYSGFLSRPHYVNTVQHSGLFVVVFPPSVCSTLSLFVYYGHEEIEFTEVLSLCPQETRLHREDVRCGSRNRTLVLFVVFSGIISPRCFSVPKTRRHRSLVRLVLPGNTLHRDVVHCVLINCNRGLSRTRAAGTVRCVPSWVCVCVPMTRMFHLTLCSRWFFFLLYNNFYCPFHISRTNSQLLIDTWST
jgi:hypothetical protein